MSYTTMLEKTFHKFDNIDSGWVTFITDHVDLLKDSAEIFFFEAKHHTYIYRLESFLRSQGRPASTAWIVRLINNIPTNQQFDLSGHILLPSTELITKLRRDYQKHYDRINKL